MTAAPTATGEPYTWLARVYDRWTTDNDYPRWARFVRAQAESARSVLAQARAKLPAVEFFQWEIPAPAPELPTGFDLVTCSFDSVNYLRGDTAAMFFHHAARALAPGGTLVLDVNSERKLREVFGNSHYGDDLGDFAYVWRNRSRPAESEVDFLITLFVTAPPAGSSATPSIMCSGGSLPVSWPATRRPPG